MCSWFMLNCSELLVKVFNFHIFYKLSYFVNGGHAVTKFDDVDLNISFILISKKNFFLVSDLQYTF